MLNRDGIKKKTYGAPKQILANVEFQISVGCIVPQSLGVDIGGGVKLAKAGTPINIDFMNLQTVAKKPAAASGEGSNTTPAIPMNAVLLHDVDVSGGNANGTALIFGVVNVNRVEADVATAIATAKAIDGSTTQVTFLKV